MATATSFHQSESPQRLRLLSLVSDVRALMRVVCNLSGLRCLLCDPLLERRTASSITLSHESGESLHLNVRGAGRPVVLVHGLGGSRHDWNAAAEYLAAGYQVMTLDLSGHGSRAALKDRPTLQSMARDLELVVARLCHERPLLVGHSLGALVVMQYIQDFGTSGLAGVCFIDQSPKITNDSHWKLGLLGSLTHAELESMIARLKRSFQPRVNTPDYHASHGVVRRAVLSKVHERVAPLLSILESLVTTDFREVVARLSLPALVVLGEVSHHYGGVPLAQYYDSTLRQGTVLTYPSASHSPHRQEPERFAIDLANFANQIF